MRVNTDELQRQASELIAVAGRVNDIQDSVLRIARNLGREQFGERFRTPLNSAANAIGRRSEELRRMRNALNQIARLYEQTEMRITDEAEHASVHHLQSSIGNVLIPDVWQIPIDGSAAQEAMELIPWIGSGLVPGNLVSSIREILLRRINQEDTKDLWEGFRENLLAAFDISEEPVWISEGSARWLQNLDDQLLDWIDSDLIDVGSNLDLVAGIVTQAIWQTTHVRIPSMNEIGNPLERIMEQAREVQDIMAEIADADVLATNGDGGLELHPPVQINPVDAVIYDENGNVIARAMNQGASGLADLIGEGVENVLEQIPTVGPGSNFGTISAELIQDAFNAVAEAIGDSGFTAGPSPSLDPVGPSLIMDPILEAIDTGADIINLVSDVPTMGEAIAGGVGAIDWTPWNP